MQFSKLLTYSFSPNVGTLDRLFRILSGGAIATAPWIGLSLSQPATILLTLLGLAWLGLAWLGLAWLMTGVVSRCGMYYLLGMSTKPS